MVRDLTFWPRYLASLLLVPRAVAWTLLWRNETTPSSVEDGQSAQNCTQIWHEEGRQFSWDPEGPWCLKFYSDPSCDYSNGISCEGRLWKQQATQNISAFSVYPMPDSSVTAFGFASSTAIPTTTTTATSTPTDTNAEQTPVAETASGGSSKLSAGAIAGIAVGAAVAVALLCAVFFYLGRRSRRKAAAAAAVAATSLPKSDSPSAAPLNTSSSTNPSSPPSDDVSSSATLAASGTIAELPKPPMVEIQHVSPPDYIQPLNGTRIIELPGQTPEVELSNTQQVQEMSVSRQIQELEGHGTEKRGL
ncbi:uncharacterized protein BDW70DRAFT_51059 [Aspergillus foveolatus]|uniref:uncharacterized protein n=1 Tax=Aspergillus foveolatus TaxID=210207 RepID=UPI003CCD4F7C